MDAINKKDNKDIFSAVIWLTAGLLIGLIIFMNFFAMIPNMDTDIIAELDYGRAVWEEKNCFPGGWLYANEYVKYVFLLDQRTRDVEFVAINHNDTPVEIDSIKLRWVIGV